MSKSIVTNYEDISAFSGAPTECIHHCVFGTGLRALSEIYGLTIPLTNAEHNMSPQGTINQIHGNPAAEKLSKMLGQIAFEKEYYRKQLYNDDSDPARDKFRKVFNKSYL